MSAKTFTFIASDQSEIEHLKWLFNVFDERKGKNLKKKKMKSLYTEPLNLDFKYYKYVIYKREDGVREMKGIVQFAQRKTITSAETCFAAHMGIFKACFKKVGKNLLQSHIDLLKLLNEKGEYAQGCDDHDFSLGGGASYNLKARLCRRNFEIEPEQEVLDKENNVNIINLNKDYEEIKKKAEQLGFGSEEEKTV